MKLTLRFWKGSVLVGLGILFVLRMLNEVQVIEEAMFLWILLVYSALLILNNPIDSTSHINAGKYKLACDLSFLCLILVYR